MNERSVKRTAADVAVPAAVAGGIGLRGGAGSRLWPAALDVVKTVMAESAQNNAAGSCMVMGGAPAASGTGRCPPPREVPRYDARHICTVETAQ